MRMIVLLKFSTGLYINLDIRTPRSSVTISIMIAITISILTRQILTMYANPLINNLVAQ